MKQCNNCKIEKPFSDFYIDKRVKKRTGYCNICKICQSIRYKNYLEKKYGSYAAGTRARELWSNYKMSLGDYDALLNKQDFACAICKTSYVDMLTAERGKTRMPPVDHCHTTGKIRGILCQRCNKAIGLLKDSPNLARALADYLEKE